ncbi:MAG: hypothetical protein ACK4NF_03250 [Planctomycetota bacterium]
MSRMTKDSEDKARIKNDSSKMQEILPYKSIELTIRQLVADDIEIRANALREIKNYGEIFSHKLIEQIKNNPYKIDSSIVLALYELGKSAYLPILEHISKIKNIRSLKDLIFLETLIDVIKNIMPEKDKEVLYNLLDLIEKTNVNKMKTNKLFQSLCRNLKIKIFECLCKFKDRKVYKYISAQLEKDCRFLSDFVVDALKKYADVEIIKPLLYVHRIESKISELNARLIKEVIRVIYKKHGMNLNEFAKASNITESEDLALLHSILH